ncbi:MAG: hypothetical protein RL214_1008 [Pseudomonadota bacterium]|jgi:hypothetical protein
MLRTHLRDDELLLRQEAARGDYKKVKAILDRNKERNADSFNINSCSSNGNTALHWACSKFIEQKVKGSEEKEHPKVIALLIKCGADHNIKNKSSKKPFNLLAINTPENHSQTGATAGDIDIFSLINILSKAKIEKMVFQSEKLSGESPLATRFHSIIDDLKLMEFFPLEVVKKPGAFTILSLPCGLSSEIVPLLNYFKPFIPNKSIKYIGIDQNSSTIEYNKAKYEAYENVSFICADASDHKAIRKKIAASSIDIGIVRNVNFTKNKDNFCIIINKVLPDLIKPGCPLLMTFQKREELNKCNEETELSSNFGKLARGKNYYESDEASYISAERIENITLTLDPDRYGIILNSSKTNAVQDQLSHGLQRLGM